MNILRQMKNLLIDYFLKLSINQCDSKKQIEETTAKAIFLFQELFLLEKTVFALLSFCSILNHSDKILLVTLPLQQRQSARWFEKILMVL